MDSIELGRRFKRNFDSIFTYRRLTLGIITLLVFFMYIIPYLVKWLEIRRSPKSTENDLDDCIQDRLQSFYSESFEFNANIRHMPTEKDEKPYIAYVGNGVFGVEINKHSQVYLKQGRSLSLLSYVYPIIHLQNYYMSTYKEAVVTNYLTGIVHVFQCYKGGVYASYQYYAHRTIQTILVQDIKISNPTDLKFEIIVQANKVVLWPNAIPVAINIKQGDNLVPYTVYTGYTNTSSDSEFIAVSVACRNFPFKISVEARQSKQLHLLTSLNYSSPTKKSFLSSRKTEVEKSVIEKLKLAAVQDPMHLKQSHAKVWQKLWSTGFTIGTSKAKDALNGDKINATMYYVLSQVRVISESQKDLFDSTNKVSYAEGCYGDYHTLEAKNLWGDLETIEDINQKTAYWLLTLEKHGCHNVLKAGALGVVQAMVLSFGGLYFSNQHLEFNIHPKYLHREYLFRRVSYGNSTYVNISVILQEDLKTVIQVALDRSDRNYYACDAGCHTISQLGPDKKTFPVKLTQPLTAILYITHDKQHMEDLKHAIHVQEIIEAPAHEHHVIALHKHGHHLGGLPTFFWISVSTLILIFHLFLFKLIYNEYCSGGSQDKHRFRYGKL